MPIGHAGIACRTWNWGEKPSRGSGGQSLSQLNPFLFPGKKGLMEKKKDTRLMAPLYEKNRYAYGALKIVV